jgi:hypothetical protein
MRVLSAVITGLVPVIHVFLAGSKDMDGRVKPGHDNREQVLECCHCEEHTQ